MTCSFRRPRTPLVTFGALAVAALAGCGGGGDRADAAASNGSAEVATEAEAKGGVPKNRARPEVPPPPRPRSAFPSPNFDPAGPVDTTFGQGGVVLFEGIADFDADALDSVAVGADGAIYASGGTTHGAVARLLADGSLDPSFGDGGVVRAPAGGRPDVAEPGKDVQGPSTFESEALDLQPDGAIVVMGSYYDDDSGFVTTLMRLNPDGSYDASFGAGGLATVSLPADFSAVPADASIAADGSVLVAGFGGVGTEGAGTALFRVSPDGTFDGGFNGGAGIATYQLPAPEDTLEWQFASDVRAMPDGSTYVCGYGTREPLPSLFPVGDRYDALLMHYLPDGRLDPTFGAGGVVYAAPNLGPDGERLTEDNICMSLDVDSRGRVVFAAINDLVDPFGVMVMRRLPDGSPDPSFGQGGAAVLDVALFDRFEDVVVLPDDSIVAVGYVHAGDGDLSPQQGLVVHFLADGTPDPAFGEGGVVRLTYARQFNFKSVARQPDGKIVIGGTVDDGNLWLPFVLRLKAL